MAAPGTKPWTNSLHTELWKQHEITILWNSLKCAACPTVLLAGYLFAFMKTMGSTVENRFAQYWPSILFQPLLIRRDIVNRLIKPKRYIFFNNMKDFSA